MTQITRKSMFGGEGSEFSDVSKLLLTEEKTSKGNDIAQSCMFLYALWYYYMKMFNYNQAQN